MNATKGVTFMRLLWKYLRQQRLRLFGAILFLVMVDLAQLLIPLAMRDGINSLQRSPSSEALFRFGLLIIGYGALVFLFRFLWRVLLMVGAFRIAADLRQRLFDRLLHFSHGFFSKWDTGDLMARAVNDLNAVRMMFSFGVVSFLDIFIMGSGSIAFMFALNPKLTLIAALPLPLLSLVVLRFEKRIHAAFVGVQEKFSDISTFVQEAFSGIFVVRAFSHETQQVEFFERCNKNYMDENLRFVKVQALFDPMLNLILTISTALVLFFGGIDVIDGKLGLGDLVAFLSYLGMLAWPVMAIGFSVSSYQRGKASLERIEEITEFEEPIRDLPGAAEPEPSAQHAIAVRQLQFGYQPDAPVLKGVSFALARGRTLGILGRIGSGKTTLVRLLTRLVEAPPGTVFVGGHDVNALKLSALRGFVTVVPQEPLLFSMSIAENIAFGRADADLDEIHEAARVADMQATIEAMPHGYETRLGERGVNLSGGQKQRLAIARAVLRRSPVLVFDDSFSSIDTDTEERILTRLKPIIAESTTILISHRVSTLRFADHILVLDGGEVVEEGSHAELLERNGRYREIFEMQKIEDRLERD